MMANHPPPRRRLGLQCDMGFVVHGLGMLRLVKIELPSVTTRSWGSPHRPTLAGAGCLGWSVPWISRWYVVVTLFLVCPPQPPTPTPPHCLLPLSLCGSESYVLFAVGNLTGECKGRGSVLRLSSVLVAA